MGGGRQEEEGVPGRMCEVEEEEVAGSLERKLGPSSS